MENSTLEKEMTQREAWELLEKEGDVAICISLELMNDEGKIIHSDKVTRLAEYYFSTDAGEKTKNIMNGLILSAAEKVYREKGHNEKCAN